MPRRNSGRSAPRPAPRPAAAPQRTSAPPPVAKHASPPPAQSSGGSSLLSGLGSTIFQGMAFGTGSAVAHRAVDAVVGPRVVEHEHTSVEASADGQMGGPALTTVGGADSCGNHSKAFQDCLNAYGSEIGKCQFYLDMLNECRRGSTSVIL